MKLVAFSAPATDGVVLGVTDGLGVAALASHLSDAPKSMIALIDQWPKLGDRVRSIKSFEYRLEDVHLRAPIARPGKIFAIGLNYADHAAEAGIEVPKEQFWFSKAGTAVNGPFDPIERPIVSGALDYEVELVVVIGRRCRHLSASQAQGAVFGYCVGNDVSVRDWQMRTTQVTLGKSFDTHAPFGPWIVTADAVDPADLEISSFVNGQLRQRSRTRHLIFNVFSQIMHLSQAMTLEPGDLIFTGTPAGTGAAMQPPSWLKAGDVVRCEIENIGSIENPVVNEQDRG